MAKKSIAKTRRTSKAQRTSATQKPVKQPATKPKPPKTSAAKSAAAPSSVELWTTEGVAPAGSAASRPTLQELAMRWQYRMENRARWATLTNSDKRFAEEAIVALAAWGFDEAALSFIAAADVVEVRITYDAHHEQSNDNWEARIFPWEYIITTATRQLRRAESMLVVRHLVRVRESFKQTKKPKTLAILESAPGRFADEFSFSKERKLVQTGSAGLKSITISNPSLQELGEEIAKVRPDVVHVSAIDTRLALSRWKDLEQPQSEALESTGDAKSWQSDGIVLRGVRGELAPVSATELAEILTSSGSNKPRLVCFNVWYSASRIAALTVAKGANVAVGFHATFDDGLAELFFAKFYRAYCASDWSDALAAFRIAWNAISHHRADLKGTGVVLWSAISLVQLTKAETQHRQRAAKQITAAKAAAAATELQLDDVRSKVDVSIAPIKRLNYSLLHNNRPVFEIFRIRKYAEGVLRSVKVQVTLFVGPDSYPYVRTFDLDDPVVDLATDIRLPLTSELVRNVDENIQTNLHVCISCGDATIYEETHRITLLPIDLWKDSDGDRQWLPSFVLPRDPAVTQVIQNAQELLACLADDVGQGFDGYQSIDEELDDPAEGVDMQVRAIWTALISKLPLSYINPPPSYEPESQRLRTPSQVLHSGRGTCIDLTLLLAACLEFVEIHPVIFLLNGHAFPGYWRTEEAHDELITVSGPAASEGEFGRSIDQNSWVIGRKSYLEVMRHVTDGNLVPLESTLLAQKAGYFAAVEAGQENLRYKREFHSLLDIRRARDEPVTPLPIGASS